MERLVKVVKLDGTQTGEILAALDSMIERAQVRRRSRNPRLNTILSRRSREV